MIVLVDSTQKERASIKDTDRVVHRSVRPYTSNTMALNSSKLLILFTLLIITSTSTRALEAEEYLLLDDDEFGLIGGTKSPDLDPSPLTSPPPPPPIRKRSSDPVSDSKVQFTLEHAFGDSDFSPAGTFSARLKLWSHGGQVYYFNNNVIIYNIYKHTHTQSHLDYLIICLLSVGTDVNETSFL